METINENIRQLLEMLDNPDAYTEQEIQDIVNRDDDTRETYRLMVEAKRSSRHRQNQKPVDVDVAWQRFNQKLQPKQQRYGWMKIAASFIGVLLASGITFAAIHIVRMASAPQPQTMQAEQTPSAMPAPALPTDTIKMDTASNIKPLVFDNITLDTVSVLMVSVGNAGAGLAEMVCSACVGCGWGLLIVRTMWMAAKVMPEARSTPMKEAAIFIQPYLCCLG